MRQRGIGKSRTGRWAPAVDPRRSVDLLLGERASSASTAAVTRPRRRAIPASAQAQ